LLSFSAESFVFHFPNQKDKDYDIQSYNPADCFVWSLTFREECRLTVFENKVLRIFGPKRDKVTGEWRKLHNKELYALYSSPNVIWAMKSRRLRWAGHVAQVHTGFLVGKPQGRRPLGRPRCR
jgi:hypothetical protein